jgi:cytochrome c oxidase subunit III
MSPVLAPDEVEVPSLIDGGNGGFVDPGPPGGGDWGRGGPQPQQRDPYRVVVCVLAFPVAVFFAGLGGALLTRRNGARDWVHLTVPAAAYWNTAVLLGSSATFAMALRAMRRGGNRSLHAWLWFTAVLGTAFLAGQAAVWKSLTARGIFVASNPASAFFYLLTASHGTHILAVLAALICLAVRATRNQLTPARQSALRATSHFWHFMGGLWLYILVLITSM